ncbi:hypothetical protein NLM31_29785 [Bradyrhizobium sp. CCGUVB4N]|uniref:hypothetical protein n=1 Tax=Bradyrhizobium sp. CCGUVB4N TaxID=2949631 RepID=UPI0020B2DCC5|nr:hypothetical protein [Bradyrhizobium sp. CCGUVB4N]MCP3384571.1 hypothetical protein [Bradyrhizobium sp. CCGUVB4N]
MPDEIEREYQQVLRESLEKMPEIIRSAIFEPKLSATDRLKWTEVAVRLIHPPVGRARTDLDRKNARECKRILRQVVPYLAQIRDGHPSERVRKKADHWVREITTKLGSE